MSYRTRVRWMAVLLFACLALGADAHAQTPQTMRLMREKLARASALLSALVTSDWATMGRESRALAVIPTRPGWEVLQYPEFANDSRAFTTAVQALADASSARDQAGALTAYNALVSSCVECHKNVGRRRIVSAPAPSVPRARVLTLMP
jgi:Cytochrome C'